MSILWIIFCFILSLYYVPAINILSKSYPFSLNLNLAKSTLNIVKLSKKSKVIS